MKKNFFEANPNLYSHARDNDSIIILNRNGAITPKGEDPGDGSINISMGDLYTSGSIYWDSEQQSARLSAIANILVSAFGGTAGTVLSYINDSLTILGINGYADMDSAGHLKIGHSRSYINKAGEFYYNRKWQVAVLTQQRQLFEHRYFVVTVNGEVLQKTIDKVPSNGYSPYRVDDSTHFNDNAFISRKTQELYSTMVQTGAFAVYDERWF